MERAALEHVLRAAGACSGEHEFIVIGSQAILGCLPAADPRLLVSVEVDLCPVSDRQDVRDLIDGAIGELSMFHQTNGYYAQGVSLTTASLPRSWRERACTVGNDNTGGTVAFCPAPVDIVAAKLVRGDTKDVEYARVAIESGAVNPDDLRRYVAELECDAQRRERAAHLADGVIAQAYPAKRSIHPAAGLVDEVAPHLRGDKNIRGYARRRRAS